MSSMKTWMLGTAMLAGGLGLAVPQANAAQFGIYLGAPAAYVPPCPGPGYQWIAGYYAEGYWMPGRWAFVGAGATVGGYGYGRDFDHRDWDRDRGFDRDRGRDYGRRGDGYRFKDDRFRR
jgi:hypothetical protein